MNLGAIILAAGYSSRMGGFKPLMQLGGQSLLERCVGLFRQAGIQTVVIVTGHRGEDVEVESRRFGLRCIHNPEYSQGMFSSVCTAVNHMSGVDGFFILPVDIPLIRPTTLTALSTAFNGRTVIFPSFEGMRGHPPLIPALLIPAILAYTGQGGLKSLLEMQKAEDMAVSDQGILMDADTPEDFAALTHRLSRLDIGEPAEILALQAFVEQTAERDIEAILGLETDA
jgi:molybdenum cofactor cytidylyltransferase